MTEQEQQDVLRSIELIKESGVENIYLGIDTDGQPIIYSDGVDYLPYYRASG